MKGFCFMAAFQSTLRGLSSVERWLSLTDSLRVTIKRSELKAVFTAQHPNHSSLCGMMEHGRLETGTLLASCPSIFSVQNAVRDSRKSSEPTHCTWATHLCWVLPLKQMESSLNSGLLVHCSLIIRVWVAYKQFSCQPIERTCFI